MADGTSRNGWFSIRDIRVIRGSIGGGSARRICLASCGGRRISFRKALTSVTDVSRQGRTRSSGTTHGNADRCQSGPRPIRSTPCTTSRARSVRATPTTSKAAATRNETPSNMTAPYVQHGSDRRILHLACGLHDLHRQDRLHPACGSIVVAFACVQFGEAGNLRLKVSAFFSSSRKTTSVLRRNATHFRDRLQRLGGCRHNCGH